MHKKNGKALHREKSDRLLYPSFNVVQLVSRAVLNYHGLLGDRPKNLVRQYSELRYVGKPFFNRRRFGDPTAYVNILKQDHYLLSNLRELIESKTHRDEFQKLLASLEDYHEGLGIGPDEWHAYANAIQAIGETGDDPVAELSSAMSDDRRAWAMEQLANFLAWPITGGILPIVEKGLRDTGDDFSGGGWLFRLTGALGEGKKGLPDILLNECMLKTGKISGDERATQERSIAWSAEDSLPVKQSLVERIVNLLTVCLGVPEALEGERVLFLAMPLFERCESLDGRGGRFFGHLLGWLIYPLIAKNSADELLQEIRANPVPMVNFVNYCLVTGNTLASDLLGAIARECVECATTEHEPVEELNRVLPGRLGWRVKTLENMTTDDCYFDHEGNRLIMRLGMEGVATTYLALTPWENPPEAHEPLFRPPSEWEHAYVHTVAQRVRAIHSLLNDKYQSVQLEREKELAKLYFKDLTQLLSRTFLNMMSWLESDAWEQNAAAQKQRFEEQLNGDCARILSEGYADSGLPLMVFRFGYERGGQRLLGCCPEHQEMPIREESRVVAEAWSLLGSLYYSMKGGTAETRRRLQALFCQEVEYLVRFDLPHVVEAVRKTAREGGIYFGRAVKHELSRMIDKMGACLESLDEVEQSDRLKWLHRLLAHRLHTLGKDGQSHFGQEVLGQFDARKQMEFIKWMIDYSEELERLKGRRWFKSKIIFLSSVSDHRKISMSPTAFEAVFTNLWNNAHDILVVACSSKIPEGKLKERVRKTVEKVGFYHQRFPDWQGPSPRRLGILWKKDGWFFVGVLDNAPQLLTVPPEYPSRSPEGHLGMRVIQDVAKAMCEQGIKAVYEPAHSLEGDPQAGWISDRLNALGNPDFSVARPDDWTLASFRFSVSE